MNTSALRLASLAIVLVVASCASPRNKRKSDRDSVPLDSGPDRYLQGAGSRPSTPREQEPTNPDNNVGAPEAPAPNTPPPPTPPAPPEPAVTTPTPPPANPPANSQLPFGKPVLGKKGFVTSPYDGSAGMIDVRDIAPGTKVRDPYTGKIFLVP